MVRVWAELKTWCTLHFKCNRKSKILMDHKVTHMHILLFHQQKNSLVQYMPYYLPLTNTYLSIQNYTHVCGLHSHPTLQYHQAVAIRKGFFVGTKREKGK